MADDDDMLLLLVDGQPIQFSRVLLEDASERLRKCIASFSDIDPDWVPVVRLSLPELDLPPFFNRHNVASDSKQVFLRYYRFLEENRHSDVRSKLLELETRILASFAMFSDYLADKMHPHIDWALCYRFCSHLCEDTLDFARRWHLPELHRRSLAALMCDQSYHIETSCRVSLKEITDLMVPDFFEKIPTCPLTQIVKYAAKIDRPTEELKADILNRQCEIVFFDIVRLKCFVKWLTVLVNEAQLDVDEEVSEYAVAIFDMQITFTSW